MTQFLQDWKLFVRLCVIPLALFLALDFLLRLSEMVHPRDAVLSFAFMQVLCVAAVAAVAALLALVQRPFGASPVLKNVVVLVVVFASSFIFMHYFKDYAFTFTDLDEKGAFTLGRRHILIAAVILTPLSHKVSAVLRPAGKRYALFSLLLGVLSFLILIPPLARAALTPERSFPEAGKKNVLVLVIDALSARRLSPYGTKDVRTPTFDRLSRTSTFFTNARTNFTGTAVTIGILFKGASPLKTRFLDYARLPPDMAKDNIFTFLEDQGYRTASLVGIEYASTYFLGLPSPTEGEMNHVQNDPATNAANRVLASICRRMGFSLRFRFPSLFPYARRPDVFFPLVSREIDRLARDTRPFFLYAHRVIHHEELTYRRGPYAPENQSDIDRIRKDYDRAVTDIDRQLGEFLDGLERSGRLKDTIVVITADHGENFDGGYWGHGADLSEDSILIPLVILAPGRAPERIGEPVQISDIDATVLTLLGFTPPSWMDGADVLDASKRRKTAVTFNFLVDSPIRSKIKFPGFAAGRSVALYQDGLKYIERPEGRSAELYDLSIDPEEKFNLVAERPEQADALRRELWNLLGRTP